MRQTANLTHGTADSIHSEELARAARPVCIGIALLWVLPVVLVSIAAVQQSAPLPRSWTQVWPPYAISLLVWPLPDGWFRTRRWEKAGRIYERIGIRRFKTFMVGGDRHLRRVRERFGGSRRFAESKPRQALLAQTIASEKIHTMMLLVAIWATVLSATNAWWPAAAVLTVGNVLVNVYPILLQRHTRARVSRVERMRVRPAA